MELKDLVGLHKLSGVDMNGESIKREWGNSFEDCCVINFILDKTTYAVIENPDDGYRSSMEEIKETNVKIENIFKPIRVFGYMRSGNCDILDFRDVKNNKLVLSLGTDNSDDYYYYSSFIAEFSPENMSINEGK